MLHRRSEATIADSLAKDAFLQNIDPLLLHDARPAYGRAKGREFQATMAGEQHCMVELALSFSLRA